MVYFRVEVTDQAGYVVFDESYCFYQTALEYFDKYLSFCDTLCYQVLLTAYSVSEDLEDFYYPDLPF